MKVPSEVLKLVQRFSDHVESYRSGKYKEAQLRQEFINPFFKALGWDIYNEAGNAEAYKDVIHEDTVKIRGATKAPDYCFRIGGVRKFFIEAKKPSVDIKEDVHPAYQLRRYAWSAKLPLSILTDFEELAVYDCRIRPGEKDKSSTARTAYFTYDQYPERWERIASVFSKEAILKGSFDSYAEEAKKKRGTATVDDAFLAEIEGWRDELARCISLRNRGLSVRELNFAVQRTIDRIIFLRICEDRGIEDYGRLQALLNGANTYPRLCELFNQADDRYNSGLFHFKKEKSREEPDELTLGLKIDDEAIKEIIKRLYYPESPYEFSVLSSDILGQVYEQFLGKVIRLTKGHRAVIEDKPEVKKAGGVYYTPTYIVDYIVKNTVGKLLEGKSVAAMRRSPITVLDPACGSGSFLIVAYQYLLDWYRDRYVEEPDKYKKALGRGRGDELRLTTAERKRILLVHIHGVDIDSQAVEVTKLSLLLKVLEGESQDTIAAQRKLFQERALPDLSENIKCGNSLISPDFYEKAQLGMFDDEEKYRINVFDWESEYPEILKGGGFDCVVGNPPYIRIQALKEWAPLEVEHYKEQYRSASKGNYDIYVVFVERGLALLNKKGRLGFVLPHKFFTAQYGEALREIIAGGKHLSEVIHFGDQQVFHGASTYTCLMFLKKRESDKCTFVEVVNLDEWSREGSCVVGEIDAAKITSDECNLKVGEGAALFERLKAIPVRLGEITDIFVGLQTSADDVFILDFVGESEKTIQLKSKMTRKSWHLEKELLHPLVSGTDVKRYLPLPARQYIIFPYETDGEKGRLIDFKTILREYPKTAKYLAENRKRLEDREKGKFKGNEWHRFGRNQNIGIQDRIKLCVPRLVDKLCAAYDVDGTYFLDNVDVGGVTLKDSYEQLGLSYILGLVNSRLLRWYFPFISAPFRGGWWSANRQFLSKLPIRVIDFSNSSDKSLHAKMTENALQMMALSEKHIHARGVHDKSILQRQIDAVDRQLDSLVYKLYGLTKVEIEIVEEGM